MSIRDMLQWWNVIYLAPLLVSLVLITVTVITGASEGSDGGDASADDLSDSGGIDQDVDAGDGDLGDVGHDADVGDQDLGDADHDADTGDSDSHDLGHARGDSFASHLFWILGIGRMPITLLLGIFFLCWGAFGMVVNQVFEGLLKYPAVYIWPSMGATFVVSAVMTRGIAAVFARVLPTSQTYGVSRMDLVGSIGRTVYTASETAGTINISDAYGTVHRVQARTEEGAQPIPRGTEVIVLDFDEQEKRFVVRISNL